MAAEVRIGQQGRIVIPADVRRELGLRTGDVLVVRAEDGRMVLESRERVLQSLVGMFAPGPEGVVDELIEERRREFAREEAELNEQG
jgi:AbrB family looped-hinge helix DNA binding protein